MKRTMSRDDADRHQDVTTWSKKMKEDSATVVVVAEILETPREKFRKWSDIIVEQIENHGETAEEIKQKEEMERDVLQVVQSIYPGSHVMKFGSSLTGMSLKRSDLDLCLIIKNCPFSTGYSLSERRLALVHLPRVKAVMRYKPGFESCEFITAYVPILKFSRGTIHCDISLNNFDGVRNSSLLRAYGRIDSRVGCLVKFVKKWADHYVINDARMGTLSSYALSLLVINYLQCRCYPPVLPSLQMTHKKYFYHPEKFSREELDRSVVDCRNENTQTLGELFAGFIEHYAHSYNFKHDVASVRLGRILQQSQLGTLRFPSYILVEEPYNLTNAAKSVRFSNDMELIRGVFQKTSELLRAGHFERILAK